MSTKNERVGIFGGTFDPLHLGHINSMLTVVKELDLNSIRVIPTFQGPNRAPTEGPSPEQRLEMAKQGLRGYEDILHVDDREVQRGGVSYSIDTLKDITQEIPADQLYMIIGMDQFEDFDRWRDYDRILELTNLVVTSRPGSELPTTIEEFPPSIAKLVGDFDGKQALLKSGRTIDFVQLDDVEVSATEIRRRFRTRESVKDMIPTGVAEYVREHGLYEAISNKIGDFDKLTHFCAEILAGKGGINVQAFDLRDLDKPSEFTLVTSGTSTRHTSSLTDHLVRGVKTQYGVYPQSIEGKKEGRWIVLDYGALIVHVFYDFVRQEYRLEDLWKDAKRMDLPEVKDKPADPPLS